MEWLLASDTDAKVNHLYVANLRQRRHWQSAAVPGTPEATQHADAASRLSLISEQLTELTCEIQRIDVILAGSPFDAINAKFQQHYASRGIRPMVFRLFARSPRRLESSKNIVTSTAHFLALLMAVICGRALRLAIITSR